MIRWLRNRKRDQIIAQPWPAEWSLHLNRNVRLTWGMDEREMSNLQKRVKVLVKQKYWEGCHGLELTEEMQVTIAAQAGLMLLGVEDFYFDNVRTILVYPQPFRRQSESGWIVDEQHRSGEAWQGGPVVLSWRDALRGGRNQDDGHNLVIHEFAHALDGLDGEMGGNVIFEDEKLMQRWKSVMDHEYQQLVRAMERGQRTLLDYYGATNHAEFFAVASETFFEEPRRLAGEHRDLFALLKSYYQVDPCNWQAR